jgi:hypothetical protein
MNKYYTTFIWLLWCGGCFPDATQKIIRIFTGMQQISLLKSEIKDCRMEEKKPPAARTGFNH